MMSILFYVNDVQGKSGFTYTCGCPSGYSINFKGVKGDAQPTKTSINSYF